MKLPKKEYLGYGVYASYNGYQIVLTTENGISVTNIIYLESEVYSMLKEYVEKIRNYNESKG